MSKPYQSNDYTIEYCEETEIQDGNIIFGVAVNNDDLEDRKDEIYFVACDKDKDINGISLNNGKLILVSRELFERIMEKDMGILPMLWHEFGHWFYQDQATAKDKYTTLRGECIKNNQIIIDEILADDYSVKKFGAQAVKKALVMAKRLLLSKRPNEKAAQKELQLRIDRIK